MHLIPASWSHFHMLISVFPSVGLIFAFGFYIAGLATNNELIKKSCLFVFGGLGVLIALTYVSGLYSIPALGERHYVLQSDVAEHQSFSTASTVISVLAGLLAWFILWRSLKTTTSKSGDLVVLVAEAANLIAVGGAAWIGWNINHHREFNFPTPDMGTPTVWAHIHVILNHFPTVGFVFALFFFIVGLVQKNNGLIRGSLVTFVICAVLGAPTYVTGAAAMFSLTQPPVQGVTQAIINAHRDFALLSLFGLAATGCAAWIEVWRYRYLNRFSKVSLNVVLVLAFITLAIMAETGHRGGQINHPEIHLAGDVLRTDPTLGWSAYIELAINNVIWFVPWQTVHFFGYTLVFATVLVVCLRILGLFKGMSFPAVHRILPLGVFGVTMNIFTGMLMLLADTSRYVNEPSFWPKMFFLPIGAIAVLYFSLSDKLWAVKAGDDAPAGAKAVAVLVLLSWTIVIMGGRLLPYVTL